MKSISTLMAALCLFAIAQKVSAQTVTMYTTDPKPSTSFKSTLNVDNSTGFQSTNPSNATFNDFLKGQKTIITSPYYSYSSPQDTIYFKFSFTVGNNQSIPAVISIINSSSKQTTSATPSVDFVKGTKDIYFAFVPGSVFPANTPFQISMEITLGSNDKAITANTLTTNALESAAAAPLPVKFSSFIAKPVHEGVALTWNVGTEENVNGYEVEKSADQKNFTRIGFVAAASQKTYTYIDAHPASIAYYRIKSVDIDGKAGYSAIVCLKSGLSSVILKAFPTPAKNDLTIHHGTASVGSVISISSIDGRLIKSIAPVTGSQQTVVDLSTTKAGLYLVRYENGNGATETLKVMKQ